MKTGASVNLQHALPSVEVFILICLKTLLNSAVHSLSNNKLTTAVINLTLQSNLRCKTC